MALLNPVYAFIVPFLFVVTLPLAFFAGITTTIAFSILIFRVIFVYLDIALSLVTRSLIGLTKHKLHYLPRRQASSSSSSSATSNTISPSASTTLLKRHRRRRPSSVSVYSAGSATPVSDVGLGLIPSVGAERDFEGVGGWRVGDDEIWTTINSRLELPDRQHNRHHHHRSPSGGPTTPGEGGFLMMKGRTRSPEARSTVSPTSPNSSRARAPSASRYGFAGIGQNEGYFSMSPKTVKRAG